MTKLQPLGDYVIIRQLLAEDRTASGLFIPDSAQEKPSKGEVIAVGPGTKDIEMTVKKGDIVLYKKYSVDEFKLDGEKFLITRQDGIIAKVI